MKGIIKVREWGRGAKPPPSESQMYYGLAHNAIWLRSLDTTIILLISMESVTAFYAHKPCVEFDGEKRDECI